MVRHFSPLQLLRPRGCSVATKSRSHLCIALFLDAPTLYPFLLSTPSRRRATGVHYTPPDNHRSHNYLSYMKFKPNFDVCVSL